MENFKSTFNDDDGRRSPLTSVNGPFSFSTDYNNVSKSPPTINDDSLPLSPPFQGPSRYHRANPETKLENQEQNNLDQNHVQFSAPSPPPGSPWEWDNVFDYLYPHYPHLSADLKDESGDHWRGGSNKRPGKPIISLPDLPAEHTPEEQAHNPPLSSPIIPLSKIATDQELEKRLEDIFARATGQPAEVIHEILEDDMAKSVAKQHEGDEGVIKGLREQIAVLEAKVQSLMDIVASAERGFREGGEMIREVIAMRERGEI